MEQYEKETQDCYTSEDVFDCIKKVVARYRDSDGCKPKFVLLTQKNCEPCERAKEEFADDIASGIIEKVPFDSTEGMEIIKNNGIEDVPSLLLLDCKNKIIMPV